MSITTMIKSIQDIMWKDEWVDWDAQRLGQLVWLLFLKIVDDKEKEYETLQDNYKSPIPESLRWRNWAWNSEWMTGDELLNFINTELFSWLKNLKITNVNSLWFIVKEIFNDSYNFMKSWTLIRQLINKMNEDLDFNNLQDRHLFNDIYETLLKSLQAAWNYWEFYTPRAVTQFIVEMVNPQLWEKVLDPACGTGWFLTCSIEYLNKQLKTAEDNIILQNTINWNELKQLPHMLAVTNMILHWIEIPTNIKHDNSLSYRVTDFSENEKVDIIMTNPPFGGVVQDWVLTNFPAKFKTKETADLFMVYIIYKLKDNWRCWIVLPDWFLFWDWIKSSIKEKLLEECNLHTIVRLPNWVFNPYTWINTNLLFFSKWSSTKEIWYYEHQLPQWIKNYSMSKPLRNEEFDVEKKWWDNRVENDFAWKVNLDEIKARNYNLDIKNPNKKEVKQELNTKDIIEKIENNFVEWKKILDLIKLQF